MTDLQAVYDAHLRTAAEVHGVPDVQRRGPLWIGRVGGGRVFVTYRELDDPAAHVSEIVSLLAEDETIRHAEWKTRTHDEAPGLTEALTAAGFTPESPESVMLGEASTLIDASAPDGVTVRRLTGSDDIRAALEMQDAVFGGAPMADTMLPMLLAQQTDGAVEVWGAEVNGRIVSAGRIDPIPGTPFAGIWGGATLAEFRGRGIYRALTAARVRSVMARGVQWIHADCTDYSRPILERAGLVKITETVPWV